MEELIKGCIRVLYYVAIFFASFLGAVFSFTHNPIVLGVVFSLIALFAFFAILVNCARVQYNAEIIDDKLKQIEKDEND